MNRGKKIVNCRENCMEKYITSRKNKQEIGPASNNSMLLEDIRQMIEATRSAVATTVNVGLTTLYWNIGKRIHEEILKGERAEYGQEIVASLG